jgi:hypothetical protein
MNGMRRSISLPLESFALVKAERTRWQDAREEPRWVAQVRALRPIVEEKVQALLSARLVVEYNAQFNGIEMWDAQYDRQAGHICKFQKDKVFLLIHKRFVDERGNLHNENDAAFVSGNHKFYFLHGVHVDDPQWITTDVKQIDAGRILEISNVDLRREMIRRKGLEQFLGQLFHRVIDKRDNYELLQIIIGTTTREFGTYLKMLNPSIGVWHMEGVPNDIRTVADALLWRNNGWFVDADKIT